MVRLKEGDRSYLVHMSHCNEGENEGSCKYGHDEICPMLNRWTHLGEYRMIVAHYGSRTAKRSQVPLINHIEEGLIILQAIGASENAMRAFCLHPLLQADVDLPNFEKLVVQDFYAYHPTFEPSPWVVVLAMEYRAVANAYLVTHASKSWSSPKLSCLPEVNDMLIADKVQNRKDFIIYHKGTHENSAQLDLYFKLWLKALGVTDEQYQKLTALLA